MGIAEDWGELLYSLDCLLKAPLNVSSESQLNTAGAACVLIVAPTELQLDHLKPKSKGGSSLRSNLIPACQSCNHSKGSEHWLEWFERQEFYNETAKELIEEWISNKRFIEEELDDDRVEHRAAVCLDPCAI